MTEQPTLSGPFGKIIIKDETKPGRPPLHEHEITSDDVYTLALMAEGEGDVEVSLWAIVSRWALRAARVPGRFRTRNLSGYPRSEGSRMVSGLEREVINFSQAIKPEWTSSGKFCVPGGMESWRNPDGSLRYRGNIQGTVSENFRRTIESSTRANPPGNSHPCSDSALARRDARQNKPWEEISPSVRQKVLNFVRGRIPNRFPSAVNWATPDLVIPNGANTPQEIEDALLSKPNTGGQKYVWDSRGRGITGRTTGQDSPSRSGNYFIAEGVSSSNLNKNSASWPEDHIVIEYDGEVSESVPNSETPSGASSQNLNIAPQPVVPPQESPRDRIQGLTSGRVSPPDGQFSYFIESDIDDRGDPLAFGIFPRPQDVRSPLDQFTSQITSMRFADNLTLNSAVPVLNIWSKDENGNVYNLNELIFTSPPTKFQQNIPDDLLNPERPPASIESFQMTVQSPSVGGPTGIIVGTLNIKIHNPDIIQQKDTVIGRILSYMFLQQYPLKIEYGVKSGIDLNEAFRTKIEDFFIAQHLVKINDDLSISLQLTILPAWNKLMGQILVGESFDAEPITDEQVSDSLTVIDSEEISADQRARIEQGIKNVQRTYNSKLEMQGTQKSTFGSVLHGTLTSQNITSLIGSFEPVIVRNFSEALQSIQSQLLTSRFRRILINNSYLHKFRGANVEQVDIIAVSLGPLVNLLIGPELQKIAEEASKTSIVLDDQAEGSSKRKNVTMVFGNFNSRAGQWKNRPISTFPVDVEKIYEHLRKQREVGKFSDSVNIFVEKIARIVSNRSFYVPEQSTNTNGSEAFIDIPQLKYRFYKDPGDDTNWIFYIYDNKEVVSNFNDLLSDLRDDATEKKLTKDQIKEACEQKGIPWIEMGTQNSLVQSMDASTNADDRLQSHLMFESNQGANRRRQDNSIVGVDSNFLQGLRGTQTFQTHEIMMPLKLSVNHYMTVDAEFQAPIYIFFPVEFYSGLYTIYELGHEISSGQAKTRWTAVINSTRRNIAPSS